MAGSWRFAVAAQAGVDRDQIVLAAHLDAMAGEKHQRHLRVMGLAGKVLQAAAHRIA